MKANQLFLIGMLCIICTPCLSQERQAKRISFKGDKLSVDIQGMPLFEVLTEIATETGMEVKVDPEVNKTVTASFKNVPIDKGIARLIHPLDYVIKWTRIKNGEESLERIKGVEIFRKGERGKAQQVLAPRKPPRPPRGPKDSDKDFDREELQRMRREAESRLKERRPRRERPTSRYKSRIIKADEREAGGTGKGSDRPLPQNVRIRKFETISDSDHYDELSP